MSHETVSMNVPDDKVELRHISPFWAVMLAGRDTTHMVNMVPYIDEYRLPPQAPKIMVT